MKELRPPAFLSWIMNCLESNSSETVANLVDRVNYKIEEIISEIHFVDSSVKDPLLGKSKIAPTNCNYLLNYQINKK